MAEGDYREIPVEKLIEQITLLERRVDTHERMHAELFSAYQELWAAIEAIIATVIEPLDENARAMFTKVMGERRAALLQAIKDQTRNMASQFDPAADEADDEANEKAGDEKDDAN